MISDPVWHLLRDFKFLKRKLLFLLTILQNDERSKLKENGKRDVLQQQRFNRFPQSLTGIEKDHSRLVDLFCCLCARALTHIH